MTATSVSRLIEWASVVLGSCAVWTAYGWKQAISGRLWIAMLLMLGCSVLASLAENARTESRKP